jgi:decaprenyl-phosphate phosphoribosyltransferase
VRGACVRQAPRPWQGRHAFEVGIWWQEQRFALFLPPVLRMHPGPEVTTPEVHAAAEGPAGRASDAPVPPSSAPQLDMSSSGSIKGLIKTLRPHQWVKNVFVLAPMVFHKDVFLSTSVGMALNLTVTGRALFATAAFCLLAGAVYTINDLLDVEADRVHPVKRFRPIASGAVPTGAAKAMAAALVLVSIGGAYALSPMLALVSLVYFAENLAYSFKLKNVAFLDVGLIALGFVLRVLAGGIAADVHVSGYMLACTALLALFLGFGKRRHELASAQASKQRAALQAYTATSLNWALGVTGTATVATYVAYTMDPVTKAFFNTSYLWLTTPFTVLGIVRFLLLVNGKVGRGLKAESPTQEMLRDVPMVLNVVIWAIVVVAIVYQLRPGGR